LPRCVTERGAASESDRPVTIESVHGSSRWLRRLAPWVVAGVVLGVLVWRYSPRAIAAQLAADAVLALVPWTIAATVAAHIAMSAADWLVFAASLGEPGRRLRLIDVVRGRAASAMLMTINYGLSSGGYGVWLARRTTCGAAPAVGAATFQAGSDLGAVCLFALPAALLGGHLLPSRVGATAAFVAAAGVVGTTALLVLLPRAAPRLWRESPFLTAWARVPVPVWAASSLLRASAIAINIGATWGAARAFGLAIPAEALIAGLPITYLVGALPLNVLGLGAVQAAWLALFAAHADGAQILAFQFAFQLLGALAVIARGLPFLPGVLRDLERTIQR
jgi:hypothetical protein